MTGPAVTGPVPADGPLILPVGRYTGKFHPKLGAPARYRSLSVGRLSVLIEDDSAFTVWLAAHPSAPPVDLQVVDRPWDRAAVTAAARRRGVSDPGPVMDEFLADGLLVEIAPDAAEAVAFARAYRVLPLLVPLGNTPDDPLRYGIGLPGQPPMVRLPGLPHDVWMWSGAGGSLWDVCRKFAAAGVRAGVADRREHDPRFVLREVLRALPYLIGGHAACLDEVPGATAFG